MIESLPIELIQAILLHLPINSKLVQIQLASKRLRQVLDSLSFAKLHLSYQIRLTKGTSKRKYLKRYPIWEFLKDAQLYGSRHWPLLPLSHQAAICGAMLAADEWDGVNQVWDNSHRNLMWSLRWYLSPQRAFKVIQILLADGLDPAVQNHRLLVWASRAGCANVVDLLLSICDSESTMPLNVAFRNAARFGHLAIIERLLLDPRTNAAHENNAAFIYAARYGRADVIKILLKIPDVDPAAQSSLALQLAARRGHFDVVDILLNIPGVDPCANDEYAFAAACRYSHINIVRLMLKDGRIDPTFGDYLGHAYINGQFELAETLLQDPRVELTGAVLIKAARHADSRIIKLLLKTVDPTECGVMALQYTKTVENLSCLLEDPRIILSIEDKEFLLGCPQWSDRPEFQRLLQKLI